MKKTFTILFLGIILLSNTSTFGKEKRWLNGKWNSTIKLGELPPPNGVKITSIYIQSEKQQHPIIVEKLIAALGSKEHNMRVWAVTINKDKADYVATFGIEKNNPHVAVFENNTGYWIGSKTTIGYLTGWTGAASNVPTLIKEYEKLKTSPKRF